jgi:fumarate hydratase class I
MIKINLPITETEIRKLKIGDEVSINGVMVTARDQGHKYMISRKPDFLKPVLKNTIIYHCGPIVRKSKDKWSVVGAGPTTSIREEPYESEVIKTYNVRGIIGKGGMGLKTLDAFKKYGAVYLHATGGASSEIAKHIVEVIDVKKLEFGTPEAFWIIRVEDFPATVTMDSHGGSLHETVNDASKKVLDSLIRGEK